MILKKLNGSILDVKVNDNKLVYFDNAATTQTPTQVTNSIKIILITELKYTQRYIISVTYQQKNLNKAEKIKEFIGAEKEQEIVFTKGTTDSINLVATSCKNFLKMGMKF